jgi:hypothetical protein
VYGVGVLMIENENIVISAARWNGKASGLIVVGCKDFLFFKQHGT